MKLRCRDRMVPLERTAIMGVLNVTPDSFSDGSLWLDPDRAVDHGLEMVEAGADLLDVGGESTRPGAEPVPEREELRRVLPVIESLTGRVDVPVSIDTRKPGVARVAIEAGASVLNDTLGEEADSAMDEIAAASGSAVIIMHSRGTPATMRQLAHYRDVVGDVHEFLVRRARAFESAGVERDAIVLDPGFGFAKSPVHNLELLRDLDVLVATGYPVLVGTSRKSFIGALLDLPVEERVEATAASVVWAIARGAHIARVHDVGPIARAVRMADAIRLVEAPDR